MMHYCRVRELERGFLFNSGEFKRVLKPGKYFFLDPLFRVEVDKVDVTEVFVTHDDKEVLWKARAFEDEATVLDLKDNERGLVWVDGRLHSLVGPGLHVLWNVFHEVKTEVVTVDEVRFDTPNTAEVAYLPGSASFLRTVEVESGHVGLFFRNGKYVESLLPGMHLFWVKAGPFEVKHVDLRQSVVDVAGQEIMTADKVTLRMNAVVAYQVVDPLKSVMAASDASQALYREAQLALRESVGTRNLDELLADKTNLSEGLAAELSGRVVAFGLKVFSFGVRDVVLPGDMRDLLNKVVEAKKEAEANNIARREETAAMRSQANTAKLFESNPMLMRLRQLEVLEKLLENSNMRLVLHEKGISEQIASLF